MTQSAIHVDRVSKRFQLGTSVSYMRFSESLETAARKLVTLPWLRPREEREQPPRDIWALDDVSFDVPVGQMLGIIGRNGAGKSTLLKVLSRITRPTKGRVGVRGRVGSLLEVGTGFHPELTGRENVYLNGAVLGMTRLEVRRKFDDIAAFAEVDDFLDTPVKRYSSGMYVRLAFAVAAHLEPEVLVVDEVLAVGDAAFRKKCLGKMDEIGREGRTVLLVSHDMTTIVNQCRRVLLLEQGRLIADGSPEEVVPKYLETVGGSSEGEVTWEDDAVAPGNQHVRLRAVRVRQDDAAVPNANVDIGREVHIEIDYEVLQPDVKLHAALWLKTAAQSHVLTSINSTSVSLTTDNWYDQPHPVGRYRSRCTLPADFLNDCGYTITAVVGRTIGQPDAIAENAVSFEGHDTGNMRGEYSGSWAGPVIRPRLAWQTDPVDSEAGDARG